MCPWTKSRHIQLLQYLLYGYSFTDENVSQFEREDPRMTQEPLAMSLIFS